MEKALNMQVPVLYRFFTEKEHAERFASGEEIMLTTLSRCRSKEIGELRRDEEEGVLNYYIDRALITGSAQDREDQNLLRRHGFNVVPSGEGPIAFAGCIASGNHRNCYMLCCFDCCDPPHHTQYGKYCVEIRQPLQVFHELCMAVHTQLFNGVSFERHVDHVVYGQKQRYWRDYIDKTSAYVKTWKYRRDREVRMIWIPPGATPDTELDRVFIESRAISQYCKIRLFD